MKNRHLPLAFIIIPGWTIGWSIFSILEVVEKSHWPLESPGIFFAIILAFGFSTVVGIICGYLHSKAVIDDPNPFSFLINCLLFLPGMWLMDQTIGFCSTLPYVDISYGNYSWIRIVPFSLALHAIMVVAELHYSIFLFRQLHNSKAPQ